MSAQQSQEVPGKICYDDLFRGLPAATRQAFDRLEDKASYPQGTTLFAPDHPGSGIFVLHTGSVKLGYPFLPGHDMSATVALPGEILGVAAAVSGALYDSVAETLEACRVGFVSRRSLLLFLRENGAVAYRLVELLSAALSATLDQRRWLSHRSDVHH